MHLSCKEDGGFCFVECEWTLASQASNSFFRQVASSPQQRGVAISFPGFEPTTAIRHAAV
jgi:hypothetical protein